MAPRSALSFSLPGWLLVAVGVCLLVGSPLAFGFHLTDPVYRYEAAEVDVDDRGVLVMEDVADGDTYRGSEATRIGLGREVACFERVPSRHCALELHALRTNATVVGSPTIVGSSTDVGSPPTDGPSYLYDPAQSVEDGRYLRLGVERAEVNGTARAVLTYEPEPLPEVFANVSVYATELTGPEERTIERGHSLTYRRLPHEDELVRYGGSYYRIYRVGTYESADGFASCADGDEFCERAGRRRAGDTALTVAGVLAGLALVGAGGRRMRRT